MKTSRINDILTEVKQLDKEEQLSLLENLVLIIRKKEIKQENNIKLSSISGIGAEIWHNLDIDRYIQAEREW